MMALEILRGLQGSGFLFHGSPLLLTEIEPRIGRDQTSKIGRRTAVYAARDYRLAVVKAVLRPCRKLWSYGWNPYPSGTLRVRGEGVACGDGYVHVLDAADFCELRDENKMEIVSFVAVKPVCVISVGKQCLLALPDTTLEIAEDFLTPPNF